MGQTYNLNKVHIYNYRDKNREKYNEYQRILLMKKRKNPNYEYEKISQVFRRILF